MGLSVSSSSWGLGRATVCDCGTPWTFLLLFFVIKLYPCFEILNKHLMNLYLINLNLILYHLDSGGRFSFISPNSQSSGSLLEKGGLVLIEEEEKAIDLNDIFRDQTLLNGHDAVCPERVPYLLERSLTRSYISFLFFFTR